MYWTSGMNNHFIQFHSSLFIGSNWKPDKNVKENDWTNEFRRAMSLFLNTAASARIPHSTFTC